MKDDRLHLVQPRYVDGKHDGQLALVYLPSSGLFLNLTFMYTMSKLSWPYNKGWFHLLHKPGKDHNYNDRIVLCYNLIS